MAKSKSKSKKMLLEEEVLEETTDDQDEQTLDEDVPEEAGDDPDEPGDTEHSEAPPPKPRMTKLTRYCSSRLPRLLT